MDTHITAESWKYTSSKLLFWQICRCYLVKTVKDLVNTGQTCAGLGTLNQLEQRAGDQNYLHFNFF